MEKPFLFVAVKLDLLNNFLEHVESDIAKELQEIKDKNQRGEFETFDDYESARDYPIFRERFGARAVCYELHALTEGVLRNLAAKEWHKELGIQQPPSLKPKTIYDLQIGQVIKMIETRFDIKMSEVEGWSDFDRLRKMVNAFKHRSGGRRIEDMLPDPETGFLEFQWEATLEEARLLLQSIPRFLQALYGFRRSQQDNA
jgi:hypothetical protein